MSSQPPRQLAAASENGLNISQPEHSDRTAEILNPGNHDIALAEVVRDHANYLPGMKDLKQDDLIILLTPVLRPTEPGERPSDPLEALGRSLEQRHSKIRHVPYLTRDGITSYHLTFIKKGQVIILCFAPPPGQPIQLEFADMALAMSDHKPYMIVVCCSPLENHHQVPFPTLIQTNGCSVPACEATAAVIFGEHVNREIVQPKVWEVEEYNEARDQRGVWLLWTQSTSGRFFMDPQRLTLLLNRPGYAKHYVVRDPRTRVVLGFCATYVSYVSREGEKLIASLALLLVQTRARGQGIGLSLYGHAMRQLKLTRGVVRVQLGSNFPRLLYGPPYDMTIDEKWFHKRGWILNKNIPGQGQAIYDMVLDFRSWQYVQTDSPVTKFRLCTQEDMGQVLELVESISVQQEKMAWYDRYYSLMDGSNVKDVVLAIENGKIIATALTYTPSCGSKIASDLPWASRVGPDTGGVTCICIPPLGQGTTIVGLFNACIQRLQEQGMTKMFLDGVSHNIESLQQLGFIEWARYRDVWLDTQTHGP